MGLQKSLHYEWYFAQCIATDIGTALYPIEDALSNAFLPDHFEGVTSQIPGRSVTGVTVKQVGIDFLEPTQTAGANWTASCFITGHIVAALCRTAEFWPGDYNLLV